MEGRLSLAQILSRAVLIFSCSAAGYVLAKQVELAYEPWSGLAIGFGFAMFVLLVEAVVKQFSVKAIIGGTMGLVVGLGIAMLISYPLGRFMESVPMAVSVYGVTACTFGYIGIILGSGKIFEIRSSRWPFSHQEEVPKGMDKLLDTSALIDGRIADVVESGFLEGRLVVPRFVLNELQGVADSPDPVKRSRGRRGLEMLNRLKELNHGHVEITDEDDSSQTEVDQKLVSLARKGKMAIITTDFNLNQIATLQGVNILNVNTLAQALRPAVLPGELLTVEIIKQGKSHNQGVGYLEDGTMVVIENARRHIGQEVEVAVTSVLQTSAGRMIFTELNGPQDGGRNQASAA